MKRSKSFDKNNLLLYFIATPIGNLGEFPKRAIDTINEMDLIACEDTRNTQKLLSCFGIKKDLFSLREHNEISAAENIISKIKSGLKVAYVSDAGYPCVSDPGNILCKKALENDICVSTICGSSAFLNALVSSGLSTEHFYFHGFLSPKENEAKNDLDLLKNKKETLIFYESPHRIMRTINLLYSSFGNRNAVIFRELTKINEESIRGTLSELLTLNEETLIGEMVIIVEGNFSEDKISDLEIKNRIKDLLELGVNKKAAIEIAAHELKVNKNRIKDLVIKD